MAIENVKEIGKYLEENKDKKDVQVLVKGLQKDPFENIKTKEDAAKFILGNDLFKQAQESYKDVGVTGGIKTYKENNFDKDYQERYDKEHPPEDEKDKRLRAVEKELAESKTSGMRDKMRGIAISKGTELKLNKKAMGLLDNFIGADEAATIQNITNYADAMNEVSQTERERILKEHGIKPEEGDKRAEGVLYTKEQLENMSPEDQRENWDKVQKSMQQL